MRAVQCGHLSTQEEIRRHELSIYPQRLPLRVRSRFIASRISSGEPLKYHECSAAHSKYYVRKVDMGSGCPKSPFVNARVWPDSA